MTNPNFADKTALLALLMLAGIPDVIVATAESMNQIDTLLARGQRDDFFAGRFSTVAETASGGNFNELLKIQMLVMSGGSMADNLVDFQVKKAATEVDPWSTPWMDAVKQELCKLLGDAALENVILLLEQAARPKGDAGALPCAGLPSEIKTHLALYHKATDALSDAETSDTDPNIIAKLKDEQRQAREALYVDFFHSFTSHTSLLNYDISLPAVNFKGETLHKDENGNPKLVKIAFGFRADACRSATKKKTTKKKEVAPPTDGAPQAPKTIDAPSADDDSDEDEDDDDDSDENSNS